MYAIYYERAVLEYSILSFPPYAIDPKLSECTGEQENTLGTG